MERISVIIPAYNEEGSIASVIRRVREVLGSGDADEIIVVDDGSTDRTAEEAGMPGVQIIRNPVNMGYGFSLKRGFSIAHNECVVITDADGTYPIECIPALVAEYEKGIDMVVGARQGVRYWSSMTKTIARLCFKWMSEFVVGRRIPDINSGLRVIRKSRILPVLPDLSNAFSFTTSSTLIFFLKHYFVSYIPITYHERRGTSKVRYVRDAIRTMQIMVEIIARYNPIKLFLLVAAFPMGLGVLFFVWGLVAHQVYMLVLCVVSLFVALLLLSLGFFATIFRQR